MIAQAVIEAMSFIAKNSLFFVMVYFGFVRIVVPSRLHIGHPRDQ
jgi:hypothetical protein